MSGSGAVRQCGENELVIHHAWTTRVVADEDSRVPWALVTHSLNIFRTLHLSVRYVIHTTGPKNFFVCIYCFLTIYSRYLKRVISKMDGCVYLKQNWLPKMPAQTISRPYEIYMWTHIWTYVQPPLWSSGQSSNHYHISWEVVGLERGPLSLASTIE
jgi:hypothetical protein